MARTHDMPCPATALTAEVNAHLLGVEAVEARGTDTTRDEAAAALGAALALMELVQRRAARRAA